MRVVNNIISPITKGIETIADSSSHSANVARRASRIQDVGSVRTRVAEGTGYVSGAIKPIVDGLSSYSDSVGVITSTAKKVSHKVRAHKNTVMKENPDASSIKAKLGGLKDSVPTIKKALKEIVGINDIKAAKKDKGLIAGVKETAKAAARVSLSGILYIAGNFIPIPGTSIVGYILGEKVANKVLGKPYTKIAKNIIKA